MALKGKEEVILVRPGGVDHHGDPSGEALTLAILKQCVIWPRVSTEVAVEGTVITEGYNVWIPWGPNAEALTIVNEEIGSVLELAATDRVIVRGDEWQVDGTPADQRTLRSKRLGLQMVTRRIV